MIFKPNFLVRTSCAAAPQTPSHPDACGQQARLSFAGTIAHDAQQNVVAVVAAVALGLGWLIAGRVLRPLRTITATAREISATNLNQRLAVVGPDDEFRQLGETLDGLFGRLEASFQAQRHFVANASHELRTPLTAEKTVLQVALADPDATTAMLRSACEKALQWNEQQERLIDALLTLASAQVIGGVLAVLVTRALYPGVTLAEAADVMVPHLRDQGAPPSGPSADGYGSPSGPVSGQRQPR